MTDVAAEGPKELTDDDILQRFLRTKNQPTGSKTLGYQMLSVSQELMQVEVQFTASADLHANPMRQVQGGYLCAMLDEVMSVACMVASKMTHVAPTIEMKTQFLRPAAFGLIKGVGRVKKWGRTVAFTEGELFDPEGRILATATGSAIPTPYSNYKG